MQVFKGILLTLTDKLGIHFLFETIINFDLSVFRVSLLDASQINTLSNSTLAEASNQMDEMNAITAKINEKNQQNPRRKSYQSQNKKQYNGGRLQTGNRQRPHQNNTRRNAFFNKQNVFYNSNIRPSTQLFQPNFSASPAFYQQQMFPPLPVNHHMNNPNGGNKNYSHNSFVQSRWDLPYSGNEHRNNSNGAWFNRMKRGVY